MKLSFVLCSALVLAAPGCKRKEMDSVPQSAPTEPAKASKPLDHLEDGELLQGTVSAFGLLLPRDFKVDGRYGDMVRATAPVAPKLVVRYLKTRLTGGSFVDNGSRASFVQAKAGEEPKLLTVSVEAEPTRAGWGSLLIVRNTTPPPKSVGMTDEERLKRVGIDRDSRLLNPTTIE